MKNDIDFQMHSLCILSIINELCSITNDCPNHWGRERIYWEEHVDLKTFERKFHILYRMGYSSFVRLHDILSPFLNRMESRSRSIEVISNVMIVACGLRYLAGEQLIETLLLTLLETKNLQGLGIILQGMLATSMEMTLMYCSIQ